MLRLLLLSLCILAVGCVTSQVQRLDPNFRSARSPDSILVFDEEPEQSYGVIARIESQTGNVFENVDDLHTNIIKQAALLGGDAVIVGPETKETEFIILMNGMLPSETKKVSAEVIVFH